MATDGWQGVTQTDIARRTVKATSRRLNGDAAAPSGQSGRHKYRAEPCIVTSDGTLFTRTEIETAEVASKNCLTGTGTLQERAVRAGIIGLWFASTKEGRRYLGLLALLKAGAITDLRLQVPFPLAVVSAVDGVSRVIGNWIADFVYRRFGESALTTEDTKGCKTPLYLRSKKHFQAQYGLPILET